MSTFKASICINNLGSVGVSPQDLVTFYSNFDNYDQEINPPIPFSAITGNECPYILQNVPLTTTTIKVKVGNSCVDIPVNSCDPCNDYEIGPQGLISNSANTVLMQGLSGNTGFISAFRLLWFGPDDPNTLAFTSGSNLPADYPHPLGQFLSTSPSLTPGRYFYRVDEVHVYDPNGDYIIKFKMLPNYSGTTPAPSLFSCTGGTLVETFTCNNGISPEPYVHRLQYRFQQQQGQLNLRDYSSIITLNSSVKYIPFYFTGFEVFDDLKIIFSGSSYSQPLIIENYRVGTDAGNDDYSPNSNPRKNNTFSEIKKILTLTGLTVNDGDRLFFSVSGNTTITQTNWDFGFGCRSENYNITSAECLRKYKNQPFKIKKDTITFDNLPCNQFRVKFQVSGCTSDDIINFTNSDLLLQTSFLNRSGIDPFTSADNTNQSLYNVSLEPLYSGYTVNSFFNSEFRNVSSSCELAAGSYSISKSVGTLTFTFTNQSDRDVYLSSIIASRNSILPGFVDDPTNINYYRNFRLRFPFQNYSQCFNPGTGGDGGSGGFSTPFKDPDFHIKTIISSGGTSGAWTLTLTTQPIVNQYTCPPPVACISDGCVATINDIVSRHNQTHNDTIQQYTTTLRRNIPSDYAWGSINLPGSGVPTREREDTFLEYQLSPVYHTQTYVNSSSNYNFIPSLSGESWNWKDNFGIKEISLNDVRYVKSLFWYRVEVQQFSPFRFKIYANPINNFSFPTFTSFIEIYDSATPNIFNPNYIF